MIRINPKPEPNPTKEYGFTRQDFTLFLLGTKFLGEDDIVCCWKINNKDFLEFDVIKKEKS